MFRGLDGVVAGVRTVFDEVAGGDGVGLATLVGRVVGVTARDVETNVGCGAVGTETDVGRILTLDSALDDEATPGSTARDEDSKVVGNAPEIGVRPAEGMTAFEVVMPLVWSAVSELGGFAEEIIDVGTTGD